MSILLETKNLKRYYGKKHQKTLVKAVDQVSLKIEKGKSLALIGESGSGKTTFGKLIAGLEKPTEGSITFQGREIQKLSNKELRNVRRNMQMIFQSSGGVFDPQYTIGESITEILKNYEKMTAAQYREKVSEILQKVGLDARYANRYVYSLSGGQCQRANIARALVLRPKLVICDEPVSSLDYSIRKQILNLLRDMQREFDVTYLLITHDLSNVPYVCQHVAIMYQGTIVEYIKSTENIEKIAIHPYTKLLFASIPARRPEDRKIMSEGENSSMAEVFEQGCSFQNRCNKCTVQCQTARPALREISKGHFVACHCCENKKQ